MRTPAGLRRHAIRVDNPYAPTPDGDGGFNQTWFKLGSRTAAILPATAQNMARFGQSTVTSTATHIITFPFLSGVTTESRIVFGTRVFNIAGVADPEERHVETICLCVETQGLTPPPSDPDGWVQGDWL